MITPMSAQIRLISRSVDQTTGLVDVFVPLPATGGILLGDYLKAQIDVASKKTLVVPRKALLPEGDHQIIFTIKEGHAVRHMVKTGLESGDAIEVICADLHPGDDVVVQGNYELADGMVDSGGVCPMNFSQWMQAHRRSILFPSRFARPGRIGGQLGASGGLVSARGFSAGRHQPRSRRPAGGAHGHGSNLAD